MSEKITVTDLFRYPLGIIKLNEDVKKLQQFCKKIEKNEKSVELSNKGGFQSPIIIGKYNEPPYNNLYKKIYELAGKFSGILI
jgi:hypothetical protein